MDIQPTVCYSKGCEEVWPHNHILELAEVLEFYSMEASGCVKDWIPVKETDSWFEPLKRKIEAEGFFGGIRISRDYTEGWCVRDGHHRLLVCVQLGQYWCPVTESYEIQYDYPDEWGADDYDWQPDSEWERSGTF
jgi:hypothetical protein